VWVCSKDADVHSSHFIAIQASAVVTTSLQVFDALLSIVVKQRHLYSDEDGPAFIFQCRTGKGRTTTAMAIAGLIVCHLKVLSHLLMITCALAMLRAGIVSAGVC